MLPIIEPAHIPEMQGTKLSILQRVRLATVVR